MTTEYIEVGGSSRSFSETVDDMSETFEYMVYDPDFYLSGDDTTYGSEFTPNDDVVVVNWIAATFPGTRKFRSINGYDVVLYLNEYKVEPTSNSDCWRIVLTYGIPKDQSQGSGSYVQFGFAVGGDTMHISRSKSVISSDSRTGSGLTAPVTYGAIGLTRNSVEGADIPARGLRFNITNYYTPDLWDTSFLTLFYALHTCYNNATFYGFSAGEVLFMGCDGQGDAYRLVPIKFEFLAKPNVSALADSPFPALTALGHDLIDYTYINETSNDFQVRTPFYRYVHRVHDPANFTLLGL